MRFKIWLENEGSTPASAEVIRTGLQPQVDAEEIHTSQKDDIDKLMAIDSHMERIKASLRGINTASDKSKALKDFAKKMTSEWENFKNSQGQIPGQRDYVPHNQSRVDYMKRNQPLPEEPKLPMPGMMGNS